MLQEYMEYLKTMATNWCADDIFNEFMNDGSLINRKFAGYEQFCYGIVVDWFFDAFLKEKQFVKILTSFLHYLDETPASHFALLRIAAHLICTPSVNTFTINMFLREFKSMCGSKMLSFYNPVTKNNFMDTESFIMYGYKKDNIDQSKCRIFSTAGYNVSFRLQFF